VQTTATDVSSSVVLPNHRTSSRWERGGRCICRACQYRSGFPERGRRKVANGDVQLVHEHRLYRGRSRDDLE